ncbi:MAG: type II secretion system F family protein [Deltaproteobacteria bacterium]|nr:type II secretion system F family protein [Deltaproteobacteria bacterium]
MPTYKYTAVTKAGGAQKGNVDAENLPAARRKLRADGVYPLSLAESAEGERLLPSFSLLGRQESLPLLTRQLATLVGAGVPVVSALQSLASQVDAPEARRAIADMEETVRGGTPFGRAIEAHPEMFSELYASMVQAGEESGMLPLSLSRLADHLEEQARTRNKVRTALTYPILMAIVASLVVIFLLTVVVPKIVGVFAHLGRALPLPTRILIAMTDVLSAGWWVFLLLIAGGVFAGRRYLATPRGKRFRDSLVLRSPLVGRVAHLSALSRFSRTLSTLVAGAIPVDRALRIVAPVVGNVVISERIEAAAARVVEGTSLSEALRAHAEIPPTLVQMVAVGEESGKLDFILGKMADALDGEIDARLSRMLSLLEPAIILLMGIVVAGIVVSILLPLLEISQIVR